MRTPINTQASFTISAFSRARDDSRWKDYYDAIGWAPRSP